MILTKYRYLYFVLLIVICCSPGLAIADSSKNLNGGLFYHLAVYCDGNEYTYRGGIIRKSLGKNNNTGAFRHTAVLVDINGNVLEKVDFAITTTFITWDGYSKEGGESIGGKKLFDIGGTIMVKKGINTIRIPYHINGSKVIIYDENSNKVLEQSLQKIKISQTNAEITTDSILDIEGIIGNDLLVKGVKIGDAIERVHELIGKPQFSLPPRNIIIEIFSNIVLDHNNFIDLLIKYDKNKQVTLIELFPSFNFLMRGDINFNIKTKHPKLIYSGTVRSYHGNIEGSIANITKVRNDALQKAHIAPGVLMFFYKDKLSKISITHWLEYYKSRNDW